MEVLGPKPIPKPAPDPDAWLFFKRALHLRCPECGVSPMFVPTRKVRTLKQWIVPLDGCPVCGYAYEREPGYFLLSIWGLNYGFIGAFGLASMWLIDDYLHLPLWKTIALVCPFIPLMNFLFIRHSKSLFLAMDHYIDPHVKPGEVPGSKPAEPVERTQA